MFGQKDHVRIYSVKGLRKRLEQQGFEVNVRSFRDLDASFSKKFGLNIDEIVLIAKKPARRN
jgi:hypothetical protein